MGKKLYVVTRNEGWDTVNFYFAENKKTVETYFTKKYDLSLSEFKEEYEIEKFKPIEL